MDFKVKWSINLTTCSVQFHLAQQHDHQEEESQEEECLTDTMVDEQC